MTVVASPGAYATRLALWHALRWLVRDTFRQALRSGASWLMLAGSAACVAACLVAPLGGPADACAVEQQLSAWVVHVAALLVALTATAGMLPAFFAPHTAPVLLAKPVPRPLLLAGKCLGVIAFVAFHASVLVGGTWLALAARSGAWDPAYLLSAPLMVLHFTVFFGFSAMLATATRNGAACAFGTVLFWLLCWAMNFGRHAAIGVLGPHTVSPGFGWIVDAAYWCCPSRWTSSWRWSMGYTAVGPRRWAWAASWLMAPGRRSYRCWRRRWPGRRFWPWQGTISARQSIRIGIDALRWDDIRQLITDPLLAFPRPLIYSQESSPTVRAEATPRVPHHPVGRLRAAASDRRFRRRRRPGHWGHRTAVPRPQPHATQITGPPHWEW